ncbi:hypothetical protein POSPLADRAFT_1143422, partial [Postia placenta MAD-698-R-SB12]
IAYTLQVRVSAFLALLMILDGNSYLYHMGARRPTQSSSSLQTYASDVNLHVLYQALAAVLQTSWSLNLYAMLCARRERRRGGGASARRPNCREEAQSSGRIRQIRLGRVSLGNELGQGLDEERAGVASEGRGEGRYAALAVQMHMRDGACDTPGHLCQE